MSWLYSSQIGDGLSKPKRAERTARLLEKEFIAEGRPTGQYYGSEAQLARRCRIGNLSIREATRKLEANQLVRTRQGRGGGLELAAPSRERFLATVRRHFACVGVSREQVRAARSVVDVSNLLAATDVLAAVEARDHLGASAAQERRLLAGMVSTGFLPGDVQVTVGSDNRPVAAPYAEETLTAYEIGTKNRFLNQKLQINGDVFYYRYGGYQTNIVPNPSNPSSSVLETVPLRMVGLELEALYRFTSDDEASLSYGYTDAYFVNTPVGFSSSAAQSHLWGVTPHTVNVGYDHVFHLPGGSTLTPHADARFLSSHDLASVSATYLAEGGEAYVRVGNEVVADLNTTWLSENGKYSVTGYVRNIADNRYMNSVVLQTVVPLDGTGTQYDPRTFGFVISAHF